MPISSLVIKVAEHEVEKVVEKISSLNGARVSDTIGNSIVTLTETASTAQDKEMLEQLEQIEGVISVNLIYHNFEDVEE